MLEPIAPLYAIAGGLLIGIAAALFLLLSGRIAGVSGLAATAARIAEGGPPWLQAVAFVAALPVGALIVSFLIRMPEVQVTSSLPVLIAAGLLVGFGTRLGSGCTSGHGVCGLARLSFRSIAATATFITLGFFTVFLVRHLIGGAG